MALRAKLKSLQFAGTGVTTLASDGTGYTRLTGSFVTDGFVQGMEVVPAGFVVNEPQIIQDVQPLRLTTVGALTVDASHSDRSLTVGIPLLRKWVGRSVKPIANRWMIKEEYLPPVSELVGVARGGQIHHEPQYVITLTGVADRGGD